MNGPDRLSPWLARLRRWAAAAVGNVTLGVMSLGIAVVLWVVVTNSENPSVQFTVDARIQADGIPPDYLPAGINPEKVRVTITGPRNAIRDLKPDEVEAHVDLSRGPQAGEGQQEYVVEPKIRVKTPSTLHGEPVTETAQVTLERLDRKEFKIQVKQVGALPPGYELEAITVDQTDVAVSGTQRNVLGVEAVFADVNLDGRTINFSRTVPLEARDRNGRTVGLVKVEPATVNVNVKIKQNLYTKEVVVNVPFRGRPKTGYTVISTRADPPVVTVVGPLDQVNGLAGISAEPVDIEGAAGDVVRPVQLQLPKNVTTEKPTVLAVVGMRAERAPGSIPVVPRVVNLGPGLTAQLATPAIAVNVSGPLGDVLQLKATDATVMLDAAGLGPGTHKLEPKVTLALPLQLEGVVPEKVEIIITPAR